MKYFRLLVKYVKTIFINNKNLNVKIGRKKIVEICFAPLLFGSTEMNHENVSFFLRFLGASILSISHNLYILFMGCIFFIVYYTIHNNKIYFF